MVPAETGLVPDDAQFKNWSATDSQPHSATRKPTAALP